MEFSKLSTGVQFAIIIIIIVGLSIAFYVMLYSKKAEEIEVKREKFTELKREVEEAQQAQRRRDELHKEIERLNERLEILKKILPTGRDTQDLLHKVRNLAAEQNLDLKRFDPAPLVHKELYAEYPVHMRVFGTYQNLKIFFYKISRQRRIINIYDLDIENVQQGSFNIEARYIAVTFVLLEGTQQ